MQRPVYFDHNATTPTHPDVVEAMLPYFHEQFGNASCLYRYGVDASYGVEKGRLQLARLLNADETSIVFTSGGTESDNLALKGAVYATGKRHLVTTAIEHPAVLRTVEWMSRYMGCSHTLLPVDREGRVNPADLSHALRDDTAVVSVMMANNEIGTLQPIAELARIAHEAGALFHSDAVQAVGRIPVDVQALGADLLSLSAHKFYGPKGVGALVVRCAEPFTSVMQGGSQEQGLRGGTENVPGIVGMGKAAAMAHEELADRVRHAERLRNRLWEGIQPVEGVSRNSPLSDGLPGTLNVSLAGVNARELVRRLDEDGMCVATGSACSTGEPTVSTVLKAIGCSDAEAVSSIRISVGSSNTDEEVERFLEAFPRAVRDVRSG